jgi:hypothetical protein
MDCRVEPGNDESSYAAALIRYWLTPHSLSVP